MMESKMARALVLSSALALSFSSMAQAQRSGYPREVSLPEGTVLRAELNDRLSSTDSRPGDRFTAKIRSDEDGSGLPAGTEVQGQVTAVRRASDKQPGTIDVDFRSLRTPDGRSYPIQGSLTSLDSDSVRRTSSGRLEARGSSSKDKTKFIGYGAGAGALIGALSHGNLLTSAILGAAAGYLYGQLNKDKESHGGYSEVNLKPGTEFGVALDQRVLMNASYDRSGSYDSRYNRPDDRYGRSDNRDYRYNNGSSYNNGYRRNNDVRVFLNERDVRFSEGRPFMSNGRLMVPLADVLDAAGYRYDYDTRDREITVHGNRGDARLTLGDSYTSIDGRRVQLDAPAERINGVLYVPTQFLEAATDIRADWNAGDRTLRLTTRSRASLPYGSDGVRGR